MIAAPALRVEPARPKGTVSARAGADRHIYRSGAVSAASRQSFQVVTRTARPSGLDLAGLVARIPTAVTASGTTVTDVFGVGPIVAAYLIGHSGDIARFPTAGHYARYNGTAPIQASSGPIRRHRLNPRGNRQLNHALHITAVTQVRNDTPDRVYYLPKQAEGKSNKDAMRALKRRISDAVYRQLLDDSRG
jgi:transposase